MLTPSGYEYDELKLKLNIFGFINVLSLNRHESNELPDLISINSAMSLNSYGYGECETHRK